jgi:hypothetical protein
MKRKYNDIDDQRYNDIDGFQYDPLIKCYYKYDDCNDNIMYVYDHLTNLTFIYDVYINSYTHVYSYYEGRYIDINLFNSMPNYQPIMFPLVLSVNDVNKRPKSRPKKTMTTKTKKKIIMKKMSNNPKESKQDKPLEIKPVEQKIELPKTCKNPKCGHSMLDPDVTHPGIHNITELNDLIILGDMYHCIKRIRYNNMGFDDNTKNNGGINLLNLYNIKSPLEKLRDLIGLTDIKKSLLKQILYSLKYNIWKYDTEHKLIQNITHNTVIPSCSSCISSSTLSTLSISTSSSTLSYDDRTKTFHTVIMGPPGTGKTEVANILADIYFNMGFLKTNTVKSVKRSDLIGEYLGSTAIKTQKVIDSALGGVLLIDEAYSLGNHEKKDYFSKECLDTLNQNLLLHKGNLICIIAGYQEDLDKCFFAYNPGLKRRFGFWHVIKEYSAKELFLIFESQVKRNGWQYKSKHNTEIEEFITRHVKVFQYFGGDIELLLEHAQINSCNRSVLSNEQRTLCIDDLNSALDEIRKSRNIEEHNEYLNMYL